MRKYIAMPLFCGAVIWLSALTANATNLPEDFFIIGKVKIGETTFEEIQKNYGKADPYRLSKNDGSEKYICFYSQQRSPRQYMVFETGEMGGYEIVTGFRLTTKAHKSCVELKADSSYLNQVNGVSIGDSRSQFLNKFQVRFKSIGKSKITYENISQRNATTEEIERFKKTWPDTKDFNFDVTVNIAAQFQNQRLVDFYIRKIESN